jgi:hypothetical protein
MYLNDVTVLTPPVGSTPGVIFVNGERIEFYSIDLLNNTISQLRRGTSGTGASDFLSATPMLYDSSIGSTMVTDAGIPVKLTYNDTNRIDTHITSEGIFNYTLNDALLMIDGSTILLQVGDDSSITEAYGKMFVVYYGGILLEYDTDYIITEVSGNRIITLKIDKILSGKYLTIVKKDGLQFEDVDIYQSKTDLGTSNITIVDYVDGEPLCAVTGELEDYLNRP